VGFEPGVDGDEAGAVRAGGGWRRVCHAGFPC
jgi:hypothetical protein